jgi:sensor histidine kinase YesM
MDDITDHARQHLVPLVRRREYEYMLVDRPTIENINATAEELHLITKQYKLTIREAQIMWLLRNYVPVDLSLIPSIRMHLMNIRKKLTSHNVSINNLWRGVYQLSIVGD